MAETHEKRDYDEITYVPGPQDPNFTRFNNVTFKANVPTKVEHSKTVQQLIRKVREHDDGSVTTSGVETRVTMAKALEDNPCFSINGKPPRPRKRAEAKLPATAEQYRAWATKWIAESDDGSAMDARWEAEQKLRDNCAVDDQDVSHLMAFYHARHSQVTAMGHIEQAF
jgi:hypothetical protein